MRAWSYLIVLAAGCGWNGEEGAPAARLDDRHTLGAPVRVENLTVWPVHTDQPIAIGEFLTLHEAQAQDRVEVKEKENGGEVRTLVVTNRGDLPILLCAGTVLTGGKQDRQIGRDVVVKAGQTLPVDAFCVERERWNETRNGQETDGKFQVTNAVATAGVRSSGQYEADQRKVWANVDEARELTYQLVGANPGAVTIQFASDSSFADVAALNAKERGRLEEKVRAFFAAHAPDAVGFAYAINGEPVTVRTFAHARLFRQQRDAFLHAMCTEALLARGGDAKEARADDVVAMVQAINAAEEHIVDEGAGRNGYRKVALGFNSVCYVDDGDGKAVPVSVDWTRRR